MSPLKSSKFNGFISYLSVEELYINVAPSVTLISDTSAMFSMEVISTIWFFNVIGEDEVSVPPKLVTFTLCRVTCGIVAFTI